MSNATLTKIEDRLKAMKGKSFLYNTFPHVISNWRFLETEVEIVTDRKYLSFPVKDALAILDKFYETDESSGSVALVPVKATTMEKAGSLADILMDNIRQVQADKTYIAQAESINSSIKTYIDLAKIEVDALRLANQLR